MNCSKCGFENTQLAQFCASCGVSLDALVCQHCEAKNQAGSRYCQNCGGTLAAERPDTNAHSVSAERRVITVLFCDLVDSTVIVNNADPEIGRVIIREFQTLCKQVVEQFGGRISTYLGDGVVGLFKRHEGNAERAVNTALQLIRQIPLLEQGGHSSRDAVQVRCGVATGLAVVADDISEYSRVRIETVVGRPMNLAARIQSLAEPNGILIDDKTRELTRGLFEFIDAGMHQLKGISQPQKAWKVVAEKSISSRFVASAMKLTPMVGRSELLRELLDLWEASLTGKARTALLCGQAGVGKSRVLQEFLEIISIDHQFYSFEFQCSSYHHNTSLYPVTSQLRASAGIQQADSAEIQAEKLELLIQQSSDDLEHDMPVFMEVLSLPTTFWWSPPEKELDKRKGHISDVLINNMLALADFAPVVISIEDMQWIDPTTCELLLSLLERCKGKPVFVLMTARPEFDALFGKPVRIAEYEVQRLSDRDSYRMTSQVKGNANLSDKVLEQIVKRTEGIPLFIEEFSKSLLERLSHGEPELKNGRLDGDHLPETLQGSLLFRLENLPEASKAIVRLASVIGRDFSYDLLHKIASGTEENLFSLLNPLLEAQLIVQRTNNPQLEFSFRHGLIRDVAYQTMLQSDREHIHLQIARAAEILHADNPDRCPEIIAYHYTESCEYHKALIHWLRAGKKSLKRFSLSEAREHLETGLELLLRLPENMENRATRLEYLLTLGPVLTKLEGSAAQVTRDNYTQAIALCDQLPESEQQFKAIWGQWLAAPDYRLERGSSYAARLSSLSKNLDDPELKLQLHHHQWATLYHQGDFSGAVKHGLRGLELYALTRDECCEEYPHDPLVCAHGFLGLAYWFMGNFNNSRIEVEAAYQAAKRLDHSDSLINAILHNLNLATVSNELEAVADWTEALHEMCNTFPMPELQARLGFNRGLLETYGGSLSRGIDQMLSSIEQIRSIGTWELIPLFNERVVDALLREGREEFAGELIDETLALYDTHGFDFWKAEVYRRKGHVSLASGQANDALGWFSKAYETGRQQNALALQLRAAMSLVACNEHSGADLQGITLLGKVYKRFAPGENSGELTRARFLLDTEAGQLKASQ